MPGWEKQGCGLTVPQFLYGDCPPICPCPTVSSSAMHWGELLRIWAGRRGFGWAAEAEEAALCLHTLSCPQELVCVPVPSGGKRTAAFPWKTARCHKVKLGGSGELSSSADCWEDRPQTMKKFREHLFSPVWKSGAGCFPVQHLWVETSQAASVSSSFWWEIVSFKKKKGAWKNQCCFTIFWKQQLSGYHSVDMPAPWVQWCLRDWCHQEWAHGARCEDVPRRPSLHCWEGASRFLPGGCCCLAWGPPLPPSAAGQRMSWWNILPFYLWSVCFQSFLWLLLAFGAGDVLFSDTFSLYVTWGADACHQPSSTMVNGGLLQSVSVTPTVDSSSIHFPWCTIISLLLTLTSYPDFSQTPSQSPAHILSLVPLLWVVELTVSSLLFLPSAVSTVDRVGCHRIFQCYPSSFLMWLLNSLTCNVSRTTPKANSIGEGRTWKSRWSAQSQLCPGEGNQLLRVMQFLP